MMLVWSQEVHHMTITSHILYVYRSYFKSKHCKWEFSPQLHGYRSSRAKALGNTFGSALP